MLDINDKIKIWKEHKKNDSLKYIPGISKHNSDLIKEFLHDYELGLNVGMFKGRRTPATLTKLRHQSIFFARNLNKDLEQTTKRDLHKLFSDMEQGVILKLSGRKYVAVGEFVKSAKSFFGWLKRTEKIKENPTEDLSISASNGKGRKPAWVYLGNEKMKTLIDNSRGDYRALILFLYDSGVRPQEAWRLIVSDFRNDFTELNIPETRDNGERVSKTFERTIKLTKSSSLIKEYVKQHELKDNDVLIQINQPAFNQYLRRTCKKLFGTKPTKARGSPNLFKAYDIRHNSAIYYLDLYKRNKDLMYRFGWKKEDKIFYYTEFLGNRDKIDEDMITEEDKNKYEKRIDKLEKRNNEIVEMINDWQKLVMKHYKVKSADPKELEKIHKQTLGMNSSK